MVKSYHGDLFKGCACRHALEEVPMTGVMPFDEGMHGSIRQVVTGFTLGFWRENVRLNTKDTKERKLKMKSGGRVTPNAL